MICCDGSSTAILCNNLIFRLIFVCLRFFSPSSPTSPSPSPLLSLPYLCLSTTLTNCHRNFIIQTVHITHQQKKGRKHFYTSRNTKTETKKLEKISPPIPVLIRKTVDPPALPGFPLKRIQEREKGIYIYRKTKKSRKKGE